MEFVWNRRFQNRLLCKNLLWIMWIVLDERRNKICMKQISGVKMIQSIQNRFLLQGYCWKVNQRNYKMSLVRISGRETNISETKRKETVKSRAHQLVYIILKCMCIVMLLLLNCWTDRVHIYTIWWNTSQMSNNIYLSITNITY